MVQRSIALLLFILILPLTATSGTIIKDYNFDQPTITENAGLTVLKMENCISTGLPGTPALPLYKVEVLLPPGEIISSINVIPSEMVNVFQGVEIDPNQTPIAMSYQGPFLPTEQNQTIYNSDDLYPQELIDNTKTQYFCGYSIGFFTISPVQYRPQSGSISYFPSIRVEINTVSNTETQNNFNLMYRSNVCDRERIVRKVDNAESISLYPSIQTGTDEPLIPYLLITTETFANYFDPLMDFKDKCGLMTDLITVSEIQSTYPGDDLQEKIRNCIIDYYLHYNTTYVLLGADDEFIPHRGLYASMNGGGEIDYDVPGDIYYAALDGDWDNDNDNIFGEEGEYDLVHEMVLGRACVDSPAEAQNWVNKQLMYQMEPVVNTAETALMVGEDLGWITWGSDLKEEIHNGTPSTQGFPANFYVETLYDTPSWSFSGMGDLMPLLNMGPNLVNHMGHASTTYMMKFNGSQINDNNCTNNGVDQNFYIVYSQGCYCGAFDNRTAGGSYTSDCITENFNMIENGAVCMITNSRYGWGNVSGTNGPSQFYDRQFFDALFGEDLTLIGEVNNDSKEDCIPVLNSATLWVYYELNLFGDPTLDIWTGTPTELEPSYNPSLIVGATELEVEIAGVEGALCAVTNDGELMGYAYTDASGNADIEFFEAIATIDTLTLAITAHNYYPYFDEEVVVITPNMPYMVIDDMLINDSSLGDGDEMLDLGEPGYFVVDFHNVGLVEAEGVYALISCPDPKLTFASDSVFVGNVDAETILSIDEAFEYLLSSDVQDGEQIECEIFIYDAIGAEWSSDFEYSICAPIAQIAGVQIYDGENMRLSPGETADIDIMLGNTGTGEVRNADAVIMTDNEYVTIDIDESNIVLVQSNGFGSFNPMFNITIGSDCPDNIVIPFYIELIDEMGYTAQFIFEVPIGGFFDNMENGVGEWTHGAVSEGFSDSWGLDFLMNHSPGGWNAWYNGNPPNYFYADSLDAGLVTPPMYLPEQAVLKFWHKLDAELAVPYPGQAYDGGKVEMAYTSNMIFIPVIPVSGYPYFVKENTYAPGPFPNGTPVYSGEFDWTQAEFNLSQFPAGSVCFRFRFGSDGSGGNHVGWWIDDIELTPLSETNAPTNFQASINISLVTLTWNSPEPAGDNNGGKSGIRDSESLDHYNVYRDGELIAENIADLEYVDDLSGFSYGEYSYFVTAEYSNGVSEATEPVTVNYDGTPVEIVNLQVPDVYFIDQNYPNPFNPETNFRFGLPETGNVAISIYNIMGQEVAKLADGFMDAGYHTISWNADNYTTGIYIYSIKTERLSFTGKMLLLK